MSSCVHQSDGKRYPGERDEKFPEVFNTPPPPLSGERKPGQLTNQQFKDLFDKGWTIVESFFQPEELEPVKRTISQLVEELAQKLYNAGKIQNLYREYGLYQRLTMIESEFPGANLILHQLDSPPPTFRDVWANERLLNLTEQVLGTADIVGHPVWNLRTKTPNNAATTLPWHQDSAYLDCDSYEVFQLTAWIPLLDADEENGCLQLVENGHKKGSVAQHVCFDGKTWHLILDEDEMEKALDVKLENDLKTVAVPYGGVLLFNNMLPHRSLNNHSDSIRWSLDLRWQPADKSVGFYGLKDGIRMRSSTDPNFKIDWDSFNSVNRHEKARKMMKWEEAEDFCVEIAFVPFLNWKVVHLEDI